jgi:hypothetical protein
MLPALPAPTAENIAKVALYVTVLILPGGSLIALGLWWLNRRLEKSGRSVFPFLQTRRVGADPSPAAPIAV